MLGTADGKRSPNPKRVDRIWLGFEGQDLPAELLSNLARQLFHRRSLAGSA
jgi:hypothetical protein